MASPRLWDGISVPAWDIDRFFAAFKNVQSRANAAPGSGEARDIDYFYRQVMDKITKTVLTRGWRRSLAAQSIDPEDAAADVLASLARKLPHLKLQHPCPKVLTKILATTITRELISVIRRSKSRRTNVVKYSCDDFDRFHRETDQFEVERLHDHLATVAPEVTGESPALIALYEFMAGCVTAGNQLPAFHEIPVHLRDTISADDHVDLHTAISRAVHEFAADLAA